MRNPLTESSSAQQGVALVTTVIVIAVLAVVAVAFMQSTSVDRLSSRSVANYYRAVLAAEAGLAAVESQLATNTANDTFIAVANTNRELFVGNGISNSVNFSYAPLFSTAGSPAAAPAKIQTNRVPLLNVPGGEVFTFTLPGGLNITSPPVAWTYLTNDLGQTNARFAYWVEDLSGKLDLSVVGALGPAAKRPTGTNPAEIALWSLFNPSAASEVNNAQVAAILAARNKGSLLTPASSRFAASAVTSNTMADVAVGLRYDTNEPDLIPFGFGYADEGKPKYNLNTNLGAAAVATIPDIINRNLPQFGTRGGAMSPSEYLQNIAASIVDYADTDTNPTTGGGDPPTYRGVEAIGWPNEVFMRLEFSYKEDNANSALACEVEVTQAVELWNLSDKQVDTSAYAISNNLDIPLSIVVGESASNWRGTLGSVDPAQPPKSEALGSEGTLAPNSYVVLVTDPRIFKFSVPYADAGYVAGSSPAPKLGINIDGSGLNNKYAIAKSGRSIDAITGSRFLESTNIQSGRAHIIASASAFGTTTDGARYNLAGGDPRGQLYIGPPTWTYAWNRSTPGGRNIYSEADGGARIVDPPVNWPEGGHSAGDAGQDVLSSPSGDSWAGLDGKKSSGDPNHWLHKTSDAGKFSFSTELGNIFDPIQWGGTFPRANPFHPLDTAAWLYLLGDSSVSPSDASAGRNTLRIGRAEHERFNVNGLRAAQLLDLFTAAPTNSIEGRININTATTNVLRALAAGVTHTNDKALQPGGSAFVPSAGMVSAFVTGVTNFRSRQPVLSPAQLSSITTNAVDDVSTNAPDWPTNAVFGNTNLAGTSVQWNDAAAEEWFAKIYPLTTVRSRNFLVYAVGESLDPASQAPLSVSRRLVHLFVEPVRNPATGGATNAVPVVIRSWEL